MIKRYLIIFTLIFCADCLSAQTKDEVRDSVVIYFQQGKTELLPEFHDNHCSLERIADSLRTSYSDSVYRLQRILVVGGASPEGSVKINRMLSEKRAEVLFNHLSRYGSLPDSLKSTFFIGRDWKGLARLVESDDEVPFRDETLTLLREIADDERIDDTSNNENLRRLQQLRGGVPYSYLYKNIFPMLRASRLYLWYEKVWNPVITVTPPQIKEEIPIPQTDTTLAQQDTISLDAPIQDKFLYMDFRTNMLYDALLVPNLGVEFYMGKGWSVLADWMYGWWDNDKSHYYWRVYGGSATVRKWFGRAAKSKPLSGHHLGAFGSIFTYDFELGGRGYLGGKPGGTLWDKMHYAAGIEYGYSLPVARRLNLDFSLGMGYWSGTYHEYDPVDGCYVWQSTKQRNWIGPTKAEVSLVWLIGHGNYNKEKGGKR